MKLKIGSRGSKLALWQAHWVQRELMRAGHEVAIQIIKTSGDKLEVSLTKSSTKGLFIKEIEEALLDGSIDLAVHSLKDLPTEQPEGLEVAAVPEREDPRDVFISHGSVPLSGLPANARIATSSPRRQAQLLRLRGDVQFVEMRGNVDTRLTKLDRGGADALMLAAAGVRRLGFESRITEYFSTDEICPAAGQGALAIEIRASDKTVAAAVAPLDDAKAHQAVRAERAALHGLGGGCQLPIAAHAVEFEGALTLLAVVASPDGTKLLRATDTGPSRDPEQLGERVAKELLNQGAAKILSASEAKS